MTDRKPAARPLEDDLGWLIETARNTYWDGRKIGADAMFVSNAADAIRFARFEDAELARCWLVETQGAPQRLRSTEHMFIAELPRENANT